MYGGTTGEDNDWGTQPYGDRQSSHAHARGTNETDEPKDENEWWFSTSIDDSVKEEVRARASTIQMMMDIANNCPRNDGRATVFREYNNILRTEGSTFRIGPSYDIQPPQRIESWSGFAVDVPEKYVRVPEMIGIYTKEGNHSGICLTDAFSELETEKTRRESEAQKKSRGRARPRIDHIDKWRGRR